jgi:small subunit ribosomal protein S6
MSEPKKVYEMVTIFPPELDPEAVNNQVEDVKNIIANSGGNLISTDIWGMRELAYPVKKRTSGYYSVFYFSGANEVPHKVRDILRIKENLIRYMIMISRNMPASVREA